MQNHEKLNTGAKSNTLVITSKLVLSSFFDFVVLGEWGRIRKLGKQSRKIRPHILCCRSTPQFKAFDFFSPKINLSGKNELYQ